MKTDFIKRLNIFESTIQTVNDLKETLPKTIVPDNINPLDTIEILEPIFPFYIRKAIVNNNTEITINFMNYFITSAKECYIDKHLAKYLKSDLPYEE